MIKIKKYVSFWFLGLKFNHTGESSVNLDLTEPIQSFTDRGFFNLIN